MKPKVFELGPNMMERATKFVNADKLAAIYSLTRAQAKQIQDSFDERSYENASSFSN